MHEMGIALQIIDIVGASLPTGDDCRVRAVRLRLGKLAAVVPETLRDCFAVVAAGTPAEGAKLAMTEVAVRVECLDCGELSDIDRLPFLCAACDGGELEIVEGREMIVESIEVQQQGADDESLREEREE